MTRLNWNTVLQALVLVRLGQELGTDSPVAHAVHAFVTALVTVVQ